MTALVKTPMRLGLTLAATFIAGTVAPTAARFAYNNTIGRARAWWTNRKSEKESKSDETK